MVKYYMVFGHATWLFKVDHEQDKWTYIIIGYIHENKKNYVPTIGDKDKVDLQYWQHRSFSELENAKYGYVFKEVVFDKLAMFIDSLPPFRPSET